MPPAVSVQPYDALLLLSFGGPEGPDDVLPFLQNVTRGRGIPAERLAEVGEHYHGFGGRSPINDQNRSLIAALEADFKAHGIELPIYWGNRNWDPYLSDTVAAMGRDGVSRAAVFVTSAYSSYSGCRQYRENLYDAVSSVTAAPTLDKLRHYFNHPGFIEANTTSTIEALQQLPSAHRDGARLVFVTHSIPEAMAQSAGPEGGAYVDQHLSTAALVSQQVADRTGVTHGFDLVYCSRSGPPQVRWLEPDVNDHLEWLRDTGTKAVVTVPIGFISDHMEVAYDLDTEAAATANDLGLAFARAGTAGVRPAFVEAIRQLLLERAAAERGDVDVPRPSLGALGPAWDLCAARCCPNPRGAKPALCEEAG